MSTLRVVFPNREAASWERMSERSRVVIAHKAGFTNAYQLNRIARSPWPDLAEHERSAIYRVNWKETLIRLEHSA